MKKKTEQKKINHYSVLRKRAAAIALTLALLLGSVSAASAGTFAGSAGDGQALAATAAAAAGSQTGSGLQQLPQFSAEQIAVAEAFNDRNSDVLIEEEGGLLAAATGIDGAAANYAKAATGLTVIRPNLALNVGEKSKIKVFKSPSGTATGKVTYTSSNKKVATVSTSGMVTARKAGTAKITIKAKDGSGAKTAVQVTVYPKGSAARPEDDFYSSVNETLLNNLQLGQNPVINRFNLLSTAVYYQTSDIVQDVLDGKGQWKYGSLEQKICDYYRLVSDTKQRNALGKKPIASYIDAINGAEDIDELMTVLAFVGAETGSQSLLPLNAEADPLNPDKYILSMPQADTFMDTVLYGKDYAKVQSAFKTLMARYFTLNEGLSSKKAKAAATSVYNLMKKLAGKAHSRAKSKDLDALYNMTSVTKLEKTFSRIDLTGYLRELGCKDVTGKTQICVYNPKQAAYINSLLTKKNLPLLKKYAKAVLYLDTGELLTVSHYRAMEKYQNALYGTNTSLTTSQMAMQETLSMFAMEIGEIYGEKYYNKADGEAVKQLTKKVIDRFGQRIDGLSWMSGATKKAAKNKLAKLKVKVGCPAEGEWSGLAAYLNMPTAGQRAGYFDLERAIGKARMRSVATADGAKVTRGRWLVSPQTVNAYYNPQDNDITIPAAIMQGIFYDKSRSEAENLASIGFIVAHEITHAFDTSGARFDAEGVYRNWWTAADLQQLNSRAKKLKQYYNGMEALPGVFEEGSYAITENIADVGAMACVLDLVAPQAAGAGGTLTEAEKAKLQSFFHTYAQMWASKESATYTKLSLALDVHTTNKNRVNGVLSLFDPFYQVYGVDSKDAMYVDEKDRVQIW